MLCLKPHPMNCALLDGKKDVTQLNVLKSLITYLKISIAIISIQIISMIVLLYPGVVFGYKGILLIFGIFLAYETRSVKLKQVNDSRFVGMSIYNVVVRKLVLSPPNFFCFPFRM